MTKYSSISVPQQVKKVLMQGKKHRSWSTYLLDLHRQADEARRHNAFQKLIQTLTSEDIERIIRSSEEFRQHFKLK